MTIYTHFAKPISKTKPNHGYSNTLNALIINLVNHAPKGSKIAFDIGRFNDGKIIRALIKASLRGVTVQVAMSQKGAKNGNTAHRLRSGSSTIQAVVGRAGHAMGFDHNKLFLFSRTKYKGVLRSNFVVVSSGNLTARGTKKHQATTIISNKNYYNQASKYFVEQFKYLMSGGAGDAYKYTWPTNKKTAAYYTDRIYFFPKYKGYDPIYNTLDPSKGYGLFPNHSSAKGRPAEIRIAIANFTNSKVDIAKILNKLVRGGNCKVTVLGRSKGGKPKYIQGNIRSALVKSTKKDKHLVVKNMKIKYLPVKGYSYFHSKYMLVEGPMGTRKPKHNAGKIQWRRFVYHGTRNWTNSGLRLQDNMAFKISNKNAYAEFMTNFKFLEKMGKDI